MTTFEYEANKKKSVRLTKPRVGEWVFDMNIRRIGMSVSISESSCTCEKKKKKNNKHDSNY